MHGINLMTHPLTRHSGGIRPKQSELKMLPSVKRFERSIHKEPFPVRFRFFHSFYVFRPAPTPRLVNVPAELNHRDCAKLAAVYKVMGSVVICSASSLGTDLNYFF